MLSSGQWTLHTMPLIKIARLDRITCPGLDSIIFDVIEHGRTPATIRILSFNELLYTAPNGPLMLTAPPTEADVHVHMIVLHQARVHGSAAVAVHGKAPKAAFNKCEKMSPAEQ